VVQLNNRHCRRHHCRNGHFT